MAWRANFSMVVRQRKRWGRGLGSGRGKRSGRGNKGWLNRHSGQPGPRGFEGGQTTFFHVVPKHGVRLSRPLRKHFPVQLNKLQYWIDRGRIDPTKPITTLVLYKSGLVQSIKDGVAILAEGAEAFTTRDVEIRVAKVSAQAIRRIEELGGKVVTSHLTRAERLYYARPDKFAVPPRPSIPRDMNLLRHYLAESKRGNLTLEKVGERAIIRLKKD
ncbi:ribosomal protein L18e/L15P [Hyaloraphidium curvatum]|nr:ribosomal protein L18e/L15P [Hyaloraphidium curvatum]